VTEPTTDNSAEDVKQNKPGRRDKAAWSDADLAKNPHAAADKAKRVQDMFSAIAPSYDLNNRLHSMWRDQAWRKAAVKMANLQGGEDVLDCACGTGDLAMAFRAQLDQLAGASQNASKESVAQEGSVAGLDFTYEMLRYAAMKLGGKSMITRADQADENHVADAAGEVSTGDAKPAISWVCGDAMKLPLPDACMDVVSIAFGIRNVAQPEKAIAEFYRVLRPGGRVIILEFSLPTNPVLRGLYNFYFKRIMPHTATLIARDRSGAYKYLPRSVNTFIDRESLQAMMKDVGFAPITLKALTFGVAVLYCGEKG
jgi:demethylmenaquinone methyltransferase / 2-methoxy-6-polyprenyl-1,4-benzoquinol methylase